MKILISFIVIFVVVFPGVYAEENDISQTDSADGDGLVVDSVVTSETVTQLDKMVVTATRTRRRMSQTPASVSVIEHDRMIASPSKNVDDLLQAETGVQVKRVVGIGEGVPMDIIIRGIPGGLVASRTLILVDGFPTNAAGTPFLILNEVPMHAIKRIEVVRGPYSALYGANALGGVINIITKEGDGAPDIMTTLETSYPYTVAYKYANEENQRASEIAGEGFTETYWKTEALIEGGSSRFNYMLSGGFRWAGNYLLRDSALVISPNGNYLKRNENHDYRDYRVFGKFGTTVNDNIRLTLHTRFFDSELGFGLTSNSGSDIVTLGRKFLIGPEARLTLGEADVRLAGFFRRVTGEFWNEEQINRQSASGGDTAVHVPSRWESISDAGQAEGGVTFPLGIQTITGGVEVLYNRISFGATLNRLTDDTITPGVTESVYNAAAYLQDELDIAGRVILLPGVRFDYHSVYGTVVSPKFGMHISLLDGLGVRGTAGKAFRAPSHTEMHMPDIRLRQAYVIKSNPDLVPEKVWAFDLGVEYKPLKLFDVKLFGFYNAMEDLIVPGVNGLDMAITHRNANDAWSRGIEVETRWNIHDFLKITGNGVVQQSRDKSAEEIKKKFGEKDTKVPLDYVPNLKLGTTLLFSKKIGRIPFSASLSVHFVGRRSFLYWEGVQLHSDYVRLIAGDELEVLVNPKLRELDPYVRVDAGIKVSPLKALDVQVGVQNLFNQKYQEHGGTYAPGIFPTLEVTGSF